MDQRGSGEFTELKSNWQGIWSFLRSSSVCQHPLWIFLHFFYLHLLLFCIPFTFTVGFKDDMFFQTNFQRKYSVGLCALPRCDPVLTHISRETRSARLRPRRSSSGTGPPDKRWRSPLIARGSSAVGRTFGASSAPLCSGRSH